MPPAISGQERGDGVDNVVEVANVRQVVAPFEGDQPGVGQAFGQLQPAAVGYYAVTSVVQHECGRAEIPRADPVPSD